MKKILALAIALGMSTSVLASEEEIIQKDKSGHAFYVGVSRLQGDLADAVSAGAGSDISKDAVYSFGYDYTTSSGIIWGGYYTPKLLSESSNNSDALASYGDSLKAQVLGFYSGYQFDNNIRLTAGVSFNNFKYEGYRYDAVGNYEESERKTNIGITLGLDYLVVEKFLIGARLNTHEYRHLEATTIGFNVGYKF
ncbi:MAG: hypothetical protein ACRC24_07140 [Vibrionaceae bacterium]